MPATVSEISAALKAAIGSIESIRVYDYQPDQLTPPLAIISLNQLTFHRAFGGGDAIHNYLVTVVVNRPSERTGQAMLDGFSSYDGPTSIRAAIEADPTLGGVVDAVIVERAENVQYITANETTYLTVDFIVTVHP